MFFIFDGHIKALLDAQMADLVARRGAAAAEAAAAEAAAREATKARRAALEAEALEIVIGEPF